MKTETVRARIDPALKRESEQILEQLGLSTTEAIRLFLNQVRLRKGLPFPLTLQSIDPDVEDVLHPAQKRMEALEAIDAD
ncbi:MAG: type II toxin-antitoxin system RelB/DinJ family antitoxin [Opitutales bacterium]